MSKSTMDIEADRILREALIHMPCNFEMQTYNEMVSMHARLTRYIRADKDLMVEMKRYVSDFDDIEVMMVKPKTLRFIPRREITMKPDAASPEAG